MREEIEGEREGEEGGGGRGREGEREGEEGRGREGGKEREGEREREREGERGGGRERERERERERGDSYTVVNIHISHTISSSVTDHKWFMQQCLHTTQQTHTQTHT